MKSVTLPRRARWFLAVVGCLAATAAFAADEATAPVDDIATLKSKLGRAETKLEIVLRSYTLTTQENDRLKAEMSKAANTTEQAIGEANAAKAQARDAQAALEAAQKEAASSRAIAATKEAENARLREILRQTQDTNAALAAENARLKTQAGVGHPSPAGTYAPTAGK